MTRRGLAPVSDPAALLNRQGASSASAAAGIIVEANRPMLVEIQVRCACCAVHPCATSNRHSAHGQQCWAVEPDRI